MPREKQPPSPTLSERDAARYIGFSGSYLRNSRKANRGPAFIRVGRSVRYVVTDLEAWLNRHRVETRESRQTVRA